MYGVLLFEGRGLPSIEKLEWGKLFGGLWNLPHLKQQALAIYPIFGIFLYKFANHRFECGIKLFHQSVRLWVINTGANQFNAQKFSLNARDINEIIFALICENLLGDSHLA